MPVTASGISSTVDDKPTTFRDNHFLSQLNNFSLDCPGNNMHELMKRSTENEPNSDARSVENRFADNMSVESSEFKEASATSVSFSYARQNSNDKMISTSMLSKDFQIPCSSYVEYPKPQLYTKVDALDLSGKVRFDQGRNAAKGKGRFSNSNSKNLMSNEVVQMKDNYKPFYRRYKQRHIGYCNNYHNTGFMPLPPRLYSNKQFHSNYAHSGMKSTRNVRYNDRKLHGNEASAKNGYHSAKLMSGMEHQPNEMMPTISSNDRSGSLGSNHKYEPNTKRENTMNQATYSTKYVNNRSVPVGSSKGYQSGVDMVSGNCHSEVTSMDDSMLSRLHEEAEVCKSYPSSSEIENNSYRVFNRMYKSNAPPLLHCDNKSSDLNRYSDTAKTSDNTTDFNRKPISGGHQMVGCSTNSLSCAKSVVAETMIPRNVSPPSTKTDGYQSILTESEQSSNPDFTNLVNHEEVSFLENCSISSSVPAVLPLCHGITVSSMEQKFSSVKEFVNSTVNVGEIPGGRQTTRSPSGSKVFDRTVSSCLEELDVNEPRRFLSHRNTEPNVFGKEMAAGAIDCRNTPANSCDSVDELQFTDLSNESLCRASSSLSSSSGLSKGSSSRAESLSDIPPPVSIVDNCVCSQRPSDISFGIDYNEILEICSTSANCAFCSNTVSNSSPVLSSGSDLCFPMNGQLMTPNANNSAESGFEDAMEKCSVSECITIGNKKLLWKNESVDISKCNYFEISGFLQKAWNSGEMSEFKIDE